MSNDRWKYGFYIILLITAVSFKEGKLEDFSLYKVTAFNGYERSILYTIHLNNDDVIFLNGVTNDAALPMDVVVSENGSNDFEFILQDNDIEYINIDSDSIQQEFDNMNKRDNLEFEEMELKISETFLDWDNILQWVDSKCKKHLLLQRIPIGETYEKRDILVLKLSSGGKNPAVFIMAGEQGRDWMSTAIVLNFINNMLEDQLDILTKTFDFYFLPVFNPDGYEYSMIFDRFWNKNRKSFFPHKLCGQNKSAVGVNIDRNWYFKKPSFHTGECLSVYLGHKSLTEEEPKALANFLNSKAINLLAFINLRGFENIVSLPYAELYKTANNEAILMEILLFVCARVKEVFNLTMTFSSTANCFYNFTGNSADWVKMKLNIPVVYTIYLKEEDFILPHIEHITPLTNKFMLMARETLMLAYSIYGPLFSKQTILESNIFAILGLTFIALLDK